MELSNIGIDIGQFAFIAGLVLTLIRLWQAGKERDKEMRKQSEDVAVWRTKVDLKLENLVNNQISTDEVIKMLDEFRKEVKSDHETNVRHMDTIFSELRKEIEQVRWKGEDGRDKIYALIEKIRK